MPFYRRRRSAPLKSDKHEVTWSNLVQDASTRVIITLAEGVHSADKDTSTECEVGSHIRSLYLEFHFSAQTTTNPKVIHWQLYQTTTGETIPNPNSYYQPARAKIFQRGMEMLPSNNATVFKRVIRVRVPKIYQRMKDNAFLVFSYQSSSAEAINACGFAVYKELY